MEQVPDLSGFLAATGISIGILYWWAQIWRAVDDDYRRANQSTLTATAGTIACYIGALACLGALIATLSTVLRGSPNISIIASGLFLFGLMVVILQLMLSVWKLCIRLWKKDLRGPLTVYVRLLEVNWVRYTAVILSVALMVTIVILTIIASFS